MYTHHAQLRTQQRGVSSEVIDCLLTYGERRYRHGAEVCFMDHDSRKRAKNALGRARFAQIADRLNTYIVVSDEGNLITAAPRRGRLKF